MATRQQLLELCRDIIAPLLRADGGELYVVSVEDDVLALHMGGTCSGCPGAPVTQRSVIEPAVRSLPGGVHLTVTNGAAIPAGARRLEEILLAVREAG
jgi:Fe-S cluster biogenesis protein NfuA